jgi:acyl-coenzyme A synthetase/AMP-(fatty) acid ligase
MKTAAAELSSLSAYIAASGFDRRAKIDNARGIFTPYELACNFACSKGARELAGKSALILTRDQLTSAAALVQLDGVARRMVLCPPDFARDGLTSVIAQAEVEVIVGDELAAELATRELLPFFDCRKPMEPAGEAPISSRESEWVLPTSGTTGAPKLVVHRLAGLTGSIEPVAPRIKPIVWATFYDIRRFGGLQIFLRAILGGHSLLLTESDEPVTDQLMRFARAGVTHISGTPSHWCRLLLNSNFSAISPEYLRISGEISDQNILNSLRSAYPDVTLVHAYASTEVGVAFEVTDGREGFPASFIGGSHRGVEMRVADGSLRVRSAHAASHYLGRDDIQLVDEDGFIDTDDIVELCGDRYYFKGRGSGVVNIGGLKVHPEEIEQIINQHEGVRMSLVKARRNPFTGDMVVAEVVLKEGFSTPRAFVRDEILALCRSRLERHKVPATITFVPFVETVAGGKLARRVKS